MEKSNKNYNSIDLFKLIMAVCVVAIHTNPYISAIIRLLLIYIIQWLVQQTRFSFYPADS